MRMVSSYRLSSIEDYEPIRIVAECLHSETEDCETMRMVSSYRFSRIEDYETMRMASS